KSLDRTAIRSLALPGLVLMENAGRGFVDELERAAGRIHGKRSVVFCGRGNNGGDGFVIARHIANRGGEALAVLLGSRRSVGGDARTNLDAALRISRLRPSSLRVVESRGKKLPPLPGNPDIVVDAIFGTGFSGDIAGKELEAVTWINASGAFVASVDIPSGVDASTGSVGNVAVNANLTVAMGLAKIGHFVGQGCDRSGSVVVVDISIPPALLRAGRDPVFRLRMDDVASLLPERPRNIHKYSAGKVLVIAGSRSFTGAPVMTAEAALRSGAGAVVLAHPASIHQALARRMKEVILAPVPETGSGSLALEALPALKARSAWADAVALGPGLSRDEETMALVRELLLGVEKPFVVDADALVALKGHASLLGKRKSPVILTPHAGEFAALTGIDAARADMFRINAAREAARRFKCIIVLKGAPTITAGPGGVAYVNSTGNPGMATIGSGDVLTGLIAGFMAQGIAPENAACAGVFVHGLAGDAAAHRLGMRSLLAADIGESIAGALSQIHPFHGHR
ncbi:MAG TPA: NAD(P)H-hydrate dehydratase, partial [Bacteroidota bacterium]|nr:NAD(P)H-hydrate dehydratase [Bacteroidota bacterium]